MSFDLWNAGVPVRCGVCEHHGFVLVAISNTETGFQCLACGQKHILSQGEIYWLDSAGERHQVSLKDTVDPGVVRVSHG